MVTCEFCWEGRHYKCRGCQCSVCLGKTQRKTAKVERKPHLEQKAKRTQVKRRTKVQQRREQAEARRQEREALIVRAKGLQRTGMSDKEVAEVLGVPAHWMRNVNKREEITP